MKTYTADEVRELRLRFLRDSLLFIDPRGIAEILQTFANSLDGVSSEPTDASRYNWLREHFRFANDSMQEIWFNACLKPSIDTSPCELDDAIDQAILDGASN